MAAKAFFDSNIVIYSYATDEPVKQATARELLSASSIVLSCQVLQECVNVLRKHMGHTPDRAAERVRPLLACEIVPVTLPLVERAWVIAAQNGLSTYDAAIIAAAERAKCAIVYSEDMQHDQMVDTVRIVNPFA